jgi:hypothetical protein
VFLLSNSFATAQQFNDVGPWLDLFFMLYSSDEYSSGASFADFDDDGKDDLTFANGSNSSPVLYRNTGQGFEIFPHNIVINHDKKMVLWVDYDQDGDLDLYCAGVGRWLYRRDALNTFTDVTEEVGLPSTSERISYGSAWVDFNRDGFPDLATTDRFGSTQEGQIHLLMSHQGQSFSPFGFENFGSTSFPQTLALTSTDADNDGWEDLIIGQVYGFGTHLLRNNNGVNFTAISIDDPNEQHSNTMTMTVADVDGDGLEDFYLTDTNLNSLMRNNGDLTYTDVTAAYGLDSLMPGWGAQFLDFDGDLRLDLHVNTMETSVHFEQDSAGVFQATEAGFDTFPFGSVALCVGDINQDRVPDMLKTNAYPRSPLWQNQTQNNHWLAVSLTGLSSNKRGIGAVINLFVDNKHQKRRIHAGENILSQNSYTSYFGTGTYTSVDSLKISWPSGMETVLYDISSEQHLNVLEGLAGCMDPAACNFAIDAIQEGVACVYPQHGLDCNGSCLVDVDDDGVCDFLEIPGCTQPVACNYNPLATLSILSECTFPPDFLDCEGNCITDIDMDGICDPLEVAGCTDEAACNYLPEATDEDGTCHYLISGNITPAGTIDDFEIGQPYSFHYSLATGNSIHWEVSDSVVILSGQGTDYLTVVFQTIGVHWIVLEETSADGCTGAPVELFIHAVEDIGVPRVDGSLISIAPNGTFLSPFEGTIRVMDLSGRVLSEQLHTPPMSTIHARFFREGFYVVVFYSALVVKSWLWLGH